MNEPRARLQSGNIVRPDEAWLARIAEPILEPELPIVDPHHHLWDRPGYPYLLPELLADLGSGHNLRATVFVECMSMYRAGAAAEMRPVGETEFVNGVAAMSASGGYGEVQACAGIVSFADLTLGDGVAPVLEAHIRCGGGRFRGIRHAAGWDASEQVWNSHTRPPEGLYRSDVFHRGFAHLARLDLMFDAWLYHPQVGDVVALARAFPQTSIVLDHVGGPIGIGPYAGRAEETFARWKAAILALAGCANVTVKLGGLGMKIGMFDFHQRAEPVGSAILAEAYRPWIETCIEAFGTDRCMFESNFPVDKVTSSYAVLWNAFKRLAAGASPTEKTALFSGTAARVYRLTL
jgi:predicted TIM-barrel fold metal-dependent hydrolase